MVNEYIKKILSKLSNPSWALENRSDFVNVYGLSEDEYLKGVVNFEVKSLKKLKGKFFNTDSYENSGTYDFIFKITEVNFTKYVKGSVSLDHSLFGEMIDVYVTIEPNASFESLGDGETYYITDEFISDSLIGWEVEGETKDVIEDIILTEASSVLNNIRTYDILQLYVRYPEA